jgi:hypothetical protein
MRAFYILLFITLFGFNAQTKAQTLRFRTTSVSVTETNAKGNWNDWSEFVAADLVITIDGKKNRIVVNSPDIQVFTIMAYGEKIENETEKIVPFECTDNNGSKCNILVMTHKKENNRMQFYINYTDVKFVYNIYN